MENKNIDDQASTAENIQLVKGKFTPSQASEIMIALLDQKINYHKIEAIQLWEKDHKIDQEPINKRIRELEEEKKSAAEFISKMKAEGKKIEIHGTLKMTSSD
jgi:hypothetical protein